MSDNLATQGDTVVLVQFEEVQFEVKTQQDLSFILFSST